MRRAAPVEAPLPRIRAIFHDVETWPRWMPGLTSCRLLESGPGQRLAEVAQTVFGRSWKQLVDIRLADDRVQVRALTGLLRWSSKWGFHESPGGGGTTVSLDLEIEKGLLSRAAGRMFLKLNEGSFAETIPALELRARRLGPREAPPAEGRVVLSVYETADGFEVWFDGREYATRRSFHSPDHGRE